MIKQDDVDEVVKSSKSMMPKGLLDRYSREEILDLLAYVISLKEAGDDQQKTIN